MYKISEIKETVILIQFKSRKNRIKIHVYNYFDIINM